ncbi:MAG: CBS domain-containing protein [Bdellovibrionota bacterium]
MGDTRTAQDIMAQEVIILNTSQSLEEAFKILEKNKISGAPVVNQENKAVGVISQADLLKHAFAGPFFDFAADSFYIGFPFVQGQTFESFTERLREVLVEDAMSPHVLTVSPEDSVSTIANEMRQNKVHRILVEKDNQIVGIVTTFDLLKVLA